MNIGEAFPRIFTEAVPCVSEYERVIMAGCILAAHRVEAIKISGPPCAVILGYSILNDLRHSKPDEFYGLLWRTCGSGAMSVPSLSTEESFESVFASFVRTGFGLACIHSESLETILTLNNVVELYARNLISSNLKVRDVGTTILRSPKDATIGEVIHKMFDFGVRRLFVEDYAFVSDRRIISFLFSPTALPEIRDRPTEAMSHPVSEIGPIQAKEVSPGTGIREACGLINTRDGGCLVFEDKVATVWDLTMKPWTIRKAGENTTNV